MNEGETTGTAQPQAQQPQQAEVHVDDTGALPSYSNFCRVTATPEEVILDFGMNPQPFAQCSLQRVDRQTVSMKTMAGRSASIKPNPPPLAVRLLQALPFPT